MGYIADPTEKIKHEIIWASNFNAVRCVDYLLKNELYSTTSLHLSLIQALESGHNSIIKLLIKSGTDLRHNLNQYLNITVKMKNIYCLKLLLRLNPNLKESLILQKLHVPRFIEDYDIFIQMFTMLVKAGARGNNDPNDIVARTSHIPRIKEFYDTIFNELKL
jgi:ankyrin repeat protein